MRAAAPAASRIIVEAMTDNRNRTSADVRAAFSKYGGAMGETGSVTFMFDHVGVIAYPAAKGSEDAMLEAALEAGADECVSTDDGHEFLTSMEDFASVRDALEAKLGAPASAAIVWRPQNTVAVKDEAGETLMKLIEVLDDHDDVQNVYGNYELSDALMAKLADKARPFGSEFVARAHGHYARSARRSCSGPKIPRAIGSATGSSLRIDAYERNGLQIRHGQPCDSHSGP